MKTEPPNIESPYAMAPYPDNIYSTSEFGHLTIHQLHELAQHQQQQLHLQCEVLAQKRKQLNYLHYWREYKHRLSYEHGRLMHLRAKVSNWLNSFWSWRILGLGRVIPEFQFYFKKIKKGSKYCTTVDWDCIAPVTRLDWFLNTNFYLDLTVNLG